jgi:hypothetical protein
VAETKPQVQAASLKLADADKALEKTTADVKQERDALVAADVKSRDAAEALRAAIAQNGELAARLADAERALGYAGLRDAAKTSRAAEQAASEKLAALASQDGAPVDELAAAEAAVTTAIEKATAERDTAGAAWTTLVERSTVRFTLAPLKPLSAEQLAWSTMQAIGSVDAERGSQQAEAEKNAAAADVPPAGRSALAEQLLEELIDKKLRGNIDAFVSLFAQQPGQAPAFQATVHQALFLSNGGLLAGWLNPAGGNLTERLSKIDDAGALAEELYLSVLTRRPTAEESSRVAEYWKSAGEDRAAAAREIVWSLVTSAEFRFNR